jgi:hypothetical protein
VEHGGSLAVQVFLPDNARLGDDARVIDGTARELGAEPGEDDPQET